MAINWVDMDTFEHGSTHGLDNISGNMNVQSDVDLWTPKEIFSLRSPNGQVNTFGESHELENPSSTLWLTMGFFVYINKFPLATSAFIFAYCGHNAVNLHWNLRYRSNAELVVFDSGNIEAARITGVFTNNKWHRIVVKWRWSSSNDFKLWVNEVKQGSPPVLVFDTTTMNTKNTGDNTLRLGFENTSPSAVASGTPIGSYFFRTDDGTVWDDNDTTFGLTEDDMGNWEGLGPYTTNAALIDFGNAKPTFTGPGINWDNVEEVPPVESSFGRYTWGIGSTEIFSHGVFTDDGSAGGPLLDVNADDLIIAFKFIWRFKMSGAGKNAPLWVGQYGSDNNHKNTPSVNPITSFRNFSVIAGDDDLDFTIFGPSSKNVTMDIGWQGRGRGFSLGIATLDVSDRYVILLQNAYKPRMDFEDNVAHDRSRLTASVGVNDA